MPYVIDGNNVIGSSPDLAQTETGSSRQKLIDLVVQFQKHRNNSVVLVFTGVLGDEVVPSSGDNRLSVVFPREGESIEERILDLLREYSNGRDLVLVSSDKKLKDFVREKGGRALNAIEFYFDLKRANRIQDRKDEKEKRIHNELSDHEVNDWMKIFGDD
jgi:predicted RNA-binding protein with PIN domain